MAATERGHEAVVRVLLEPIYRCDTNFQEKVYGLPLQWNEFGHIGTSNLQVL